jgi:hypothetical protein
MVHTPIVLQIKPLWSFWEKDLADGLQKLDIKKKIFCTSFTNFTNSLSFSEHYITLYK